MSESASHLPLPNRPVAVARSRECDTACTADPSGSERPARRPLGPPTDAGTKGSGPRPLPSARTADTTGPGTGRPSGYAANGSCSPVRGTFRAVALPRVGEPHSGPHGGHPGTERGGGVYAAWGPFGGITGGGNRGSVRVAGREVYSRGPGRRAAFAELPLGIKVSAPVVVSAHAGRPRSSRGSTGNHHPVRGRVRQLPSSLLAVQEFIPRLPRLRPRGARHRAQSRC